MWLGKVFHSFDLLKMCVILHVRLSLLHFSIAHGYRAITDNIHPRFLNIYRETDGLKSHAQRATMHSSFEKAQRACSHCTFHFNALISRHVSIQKLPL